MAISVMSAATTACEQRNWQLTNLELQKLLYLAQMKYLGENQGSPLIKDAFEAWKYGPVVSRLYQRVKRFGDSSIGDVFAVDRDLTRPEHECVRQVVEQFRAKTPGQLVELTHRSGGAWDLFYEPNVEHIRIPNEAIAAEFRRSPF